MSSISSFSFFIYFYFSPPQVARSPVPIPVGAGGECQAGAAVLVPPPGGRSLCPADAQGRRDKGTRHSPHARGEKSSMKKKKISTGETKIII